MRTGRSCGRRGRRRVPYSRTRAAPTPPRPLVVQPPPTQPPPTTQSTPHVPRSSSRTAPLQCRRGARSDGHPRGRDCVPRVAAVGCGLPREAARGGGASHAAMEQGMCWSSSMRARACSARSRTPRAWLERWVVLNTKMGGPNAELVGASPSRRRSPRRCG